MRRMWRTQATAMQKAAKQMSSDQYLDGQETAPGTRRELIACVRGERGQLQRDGAAHHSMLSTASTVQAMERPHQAPVCPAVRGWRAGGVRWAGQRVVYMRCEAVYEDYQAARSTISGKRRTRA